MKKQDTPRPGAHSGKDAMTRSFEKETNADEKESNRVAAGDEERRSILGAPVDPNSPTTKGNFPPGLPAGDAVDPGRTTPGSGIVENRSGTPADKKSSEK